MNDLHVTVEPERIVTASLILRPWSADDAEEAFEIYGDPESAEAVGMRKPAGNLDEMRALLAEWNIESSQSPVPQGRWAAEAAEDARLLGGATLLPFSSGKPQLVMGWHLRPQARGRGVASQIGHALAHQAFFANDIDEVFVAAPRRNTASINVAKRLGMTTVADTTGWQYDDIPLIVLRMGRDDLHNIRPRVSMGYSYNPEGLDDW